jgi:arylsulfatase
MGRNFSVTVSVHEIAPDSAGVLVAHGNSQSGYVLYLRDGHLVAEYNYLGTVASIGKCYKVVSERSVPAGSATLGFKLEKSKWRKGATLTLLIDGEEVGDTKLKVILKKRISHEGLDVGQDRYNAVGQGYSAPFPFTARIEFVKYTVGD